MSEPLLLDTCAILWLINGDPINPEAREAIRSAVDGRVLHLSPISGWEIATLVRKRRLALNTNAEDWFENAVRVSAALLDELTWKILIRSASLPGDPPSDPADRILISTARQNSLRLVTRDREILKYASAGHVHALKC